MSRIALELGVAINQERNIPAGNGGVGIKAAGLDKPTPDAPGTGTEPARAIARRRGDAVFRWKDGMFCASVMLNP